MKSKISSSLVIALVVVIVIFLFCTGWAISGEMPKGDVNTSGWGEHSWMLIPAIISLVLSDVLGWVIFKRRNGQKNLS
jgi:hypothetical protein